MTIPDIQGAERVYTTLESAIANRTLVKAIFSRPRDKSILRTVAALFEKNGQVYVSLDTFLKDGKDIRKNLPTEGAPVKAAEALAEMALNGYRQINIICSELTVEVLVSDKGKIHLTERKQKIKDAVTVATHDKVKKYLLAEGEAHPFLIKLGVCGENGRVYDKKQAKFRQINKFLEQIDAIYGDLPHEGDLCICDLCCGKSYLTFAAYWYFAIHKGRKTYMYGVDLKSDVITYCSTVARELGWDGLAFECGDVSRFRPPTHPDLVLSLHACDIATDYVLAGAVRNNATVILSTPCCHHEINNQLKKSGALDFVCKHSMLRQKLADAATDGLRAKMLEIYGYDVTVCELIDPDETPKNLLIRAVKRRKTLSDTAKNALLEEYKAATEFLGVSPKLAELLL